MKRGRRSVVTVDRPESLLRRRKTFREYARALFPEVIAALDALVDERS